MVFRRARERAVVLGALGSVLLLAGCTDAAADPERPAPDGFQADIESWTLPLDAYRPADIATIDYAYQLALADCLDGSGIVVDVEPASAGGAAKSATTNAAGRALFTADTTAAYGYHRGPAPGNVDDAPPEPHDLDAQEQILMQECEAHATEQLPPPLYGDLAQNLQIGAWTGARFAPEVVATFQEWQARLSAATTAVTIPANPLAMPTQEIAEKFGLDVTSVATPEITISAEEIDLATADYACQVESGFRAAFYDAEVQRNLDAYASNTEALMQAQQENDERSRIAADLIVSLGGSDLLK